MLGTVWELMRVDRGVCVGVGLGVSSGHYHIAWRCTCVFVVAMIVISIIVLLTDHIWRDRVIIKGASFRCLNAPLCTEDMCHSRLLKEQWKKGRARHPY